MIKKFSIPIPKSDEKIKEWVKKISKPYDEKDDELFKKYIIDFSKDYMPDNNNINFSEKIKEEYVNNNSYEISENISNEDIIEKVKIKKVIKKVKKQVVEE